MQRLLGPSTQRPFCFLVQAGPELRGVVSLVALSAARNSFQKIATDSGRFSSLGANIRSKKACQRSGASATISDRDANREPLIAFSSIVNESAAKGAAPHSAS